VLRLPAATAPCRRIAPMVISGMPQLNQVDANEDREAVVSAQVGKDQNYEAGPGIRKTVLTRLGSGRCRPLGVLLKRPLR